MAGSFCRVAVHTDGGSSTVDLAVPPDLAVANLIPPLVDMVRGPDTDAARWRLSRLTGADLDESMTLAQQGIHDGDVLVLARTPVPTSPPPRSDPAAVAANTADPGGTPGGLVLAAALGSAVLGTAALLWSGLGPTANGRQLTAGVLAAAAVAAAVTARRRAGSPPQCRALSAITVTLAAAGGFVLVPDGPAAANALLGAAVAGATAILLLRLSIGQHDWLIAVAAGVAPITLASAVAVLCRLPAATLGALLATLALTLLAVAAKLAIALSGLSPSPPERIGVGLPHRAARHAHRMLTGTVSGAASSAVVGVMVVAVGLDRTRWPVAALFAVAIGAVLTLRARSHSDGQRKRALVLAGLLSVSTAFAVIVVAAPEHARWVGLGAIGFGIAVLAGGGTGANPLVRRAFDAAEYLSLAAVVPLACWVADLYGAVRGLGLS